jgi:hypothetical protein
MRGFVAFINTPILEAKRKGLNCQGGRKKPNPELQQTNGLNKLSGFLEIQ